MPVTADSKTEIRQLVRYIDTWDCQHCKKVYTYMPNKCVCKATDPAFKHRMSPAPEAVRRTYKVKQSFLYGTEGHISKGSLISLLKDDSITIDLKRRGIIRRFKEVEATVVSSKAKTEKSTDTK